MVGAKAPKFLPPAAVGAEIDRTALAAQVVRRSVLEAADELERLKDVHLQAQSDLLLADDTLQSLKGQRSGLESELTTLQYFIEAFTRSIKELDVRKAEIDKLVVTAEAELKSCTDKDKASDKVVQSALEKKQDLEAKLMSAKAEHDKARKRADLPAVRRASQSPASGSDRSKSTSPPSSPKRKRARSPSRDRRKRSSSRRRRGRRSPSTPPRRRRSHGTPRKQRSRSPRRRSPPARRRRSSTPPRRRRRSPTPKRRRHSPSPPRRQRPRSRSRDRRPPSSARRRASPPPRRKPSHSRSPRAKGKASRSLSPAAKLKDLRDAPAAKSASPALQLSVPLEQPVADSVHSVKPEPAATTPPAAGRRISKSPLRGRRTRSRSRGRRFISPRGDRSTHARARRLEPVRVRSRTRDLFIDSLRSAIAQRRMPFNISVVSDFMRDRDRFWKDDYPDVPFAQIARSLMDEGWVILQTQRHGVMVVGSERLSDEVRRAEDALRFRGRSPLARPRRRSPPPRRFDRPRSPPPHSPARQPRRSASPVQMRYAAAVPEDGERWEMGHAGADDRWNPS
ncbi:hypothetical protein WJX73_007836 [Symbiochloris irregularis]|uniref:Uncharacterized protein n=1 Tax=Symbiochloris irregularis TaxID=706552 RepID=A0AAW1P1C4_9CHLO